MQSLNCYVIRDVSLDDEADVGVFYRVGNDDALNRRELGGQSLVLMTSLQTVDVGFTEPGGHNACSLVISEPQCIFRQILESILRWWRITVKDTIEPLSIESIKHCVAANIGVGYLPRFAVEKGLESGELIESPFDEQSQTVTTIYAHHVEKAVSSAVHTFIQCVEESFVAGQKQCQD